MSMTAERMQPLLQLADTREQEAMRRLAEKQGVLATQEQRLAELRQYLEDYQQRGAATRAIAMLRNSHAFLARLREAEACQQRAVDAARCALETERAQWLLQSRELGVLEQLAMAYRKRENRVLEQRAQKAMDEVAARTPRNAFAAL